MFKHNGVTIEVSGAGLFTATVNEVEIEARTLEEAKERVDKAIKRRPGKKISLPVICILGEEYTGDIQAVELADLKIIGLNRTTSAIRYDELPKGKVVLYAMPANDINRATMEDLRNVLNRHAEILRTVLKAGLSERVGYGRIDPDSYDRLIEKLERIYNGQEVK